MKIAYILNQSFANLFVRLFASLFICVFLLGTAVQNAWSYRPTWEALLRHNSNPPYEQQAVVAEFQLSRLKTMPSGIEVPLYSIPFKVVFTKLPRGEYFAQMMKSSQTLHQLVLKAKAESGGRSQAIQNGVPKSGQAVSFQEVSNLPLVSLSKNRHPFTAFFYGFLKMYLQNSSDLLVRALKTNGVNFVSNQEGVDPEKIQLLNRYKNFVYRQKKDQTLSEESSPLKTGDVFQKKQILKRSFYKDSSRASMIKEGDELFWLVKNDGLEIKVEQNRRLRSFKLDSSNLKFEMLARNYLLFDGQHELPREIEFLIYDQKPSGLPGDTEDEASHKYRLVFSRLKNFADNNNAKKKRNDRYRKEVVPYSEQTISKYIPSFVIF